MSREHIRTLNGSKPSTAAEAPAAAAASAPGRSQAPSADAAAQRPVLPPGINQYSSSAAGKRGSRPAVYTPVLLGAGRVSFSDAKTWRRCRARRAVCRADRGTRRSQWIGHRPRSSRSIQRRSAARTGRAERRSAASAGGRTAEELCRLAKGVRARLTQSERIELLRAGRARSSHRGRMKANMTSGLASRMRCAAARDAAVDDVRRKYAARQASLPNASGAPKEHVARIRAGVAAEAADGGLDLAPRCSGRCSGARRSAPVMLGRATTAARGVGRSMKEAEDVKRASENVEAIQAADHGARGEVAGARHRRSPPATRRVALDRAIRSRQSGASCGAVRRARMGSGVIASRRRRRAAARRSSWPSSGACRDRGLAAEVPHARRSADVARATHPAHGQLALPLQGRLGPLCRHWRLGPRRRASVRRRAADGCLASAVSVRLRGDARRQRLRLRATLAGRIPEEVRGAVQAAARRGRDLPCRYRQPRRPGDRSSTRSSTWAGSATTRSAERSAPCRRSTGAGVRFFALDSRSLDPDAARVAEE